MRGKHNHIGRYLLLGLFLSAGILGPKMITFAGEINGNEAGVIAAASGTFSYDGKTYRAGSAYINSLTSYLSADDVDLTAEQASEAISMMYANIGDGVARGYLYEVGGEGSTTEEPGDKKTTEDKGSTEDKTTEKDEERQTETGEAVNPGDGSENPQSPIDWSSNDVDVWEAMSGQSENKQKLEKRPKKEEAAASVVLEENNIVILTKDQEELNISKKKDLLPDNIQLAINGIAVIILAITIVCGVILTVTKCMSIKRPKHRRARPGHSKRRKIRRYTRNLLTVTTAVGFLGVFLLLSIYVGLFNKESIMQSMQSSGYFRYAYSEYITDIAEQQLSDGKFSADIGDIQTYEEYLFTIKQSSLKILNGETETPIPDSNVAPYIYNMKASYMQIFWIAGLCMIISVVLGVTLMIFMDQRRERGIKHTAVAELAASAGMIVLTAVMAVNKPYLHFYVEPDYLYLFLMDYLHWIVKVMTSVTAFGVVVGMLLIGVFESIKDGYTEA
ncbi:MAG: hypothetical protein NC300_03970 [Bacteroidales bacterium]|nr:hypothetical protein [Clostridium sp.]MCM1203278.1 hypothetical protein [Bacteroidales bacterium]